MVLLTQQGSSATSQMWRGQIEPFSKHFKLVVWDMRGHGRSDYPEDLGAYSEAQTVADMAAQRSTVRRRGDYWRPVPRRARAMESRPSSPRRPPASEGRGRPLILDTGLGIPQRRGVRGLEPERPSHRGALRDRGPGSPRRRKRRDAHRLSSFRRRTGPRGARHACPEGRPGDLELAGHRRSLAGRCGSKRHPVPGRLGLYGRQNPRREEGGDRRRRPRCEHRSAGRLQRRGPQALADAGLARVDA